MTIRFDLVTAESTFYDMDGKVSYPYASIKIIDDGNSDIVVFINNKSGLDNLRNALKQIDREKLND